MIRFRGRVDEDEAPTDGPTDFAQLRGLWRFIRPYRRGLWVGAGILAVSFALEIVLPFVVRGAIDGPIRGVLAGDALDTDQLTGYALTFLAITVAGTALGYWFALLTTGIGQRIVRDVRVEVFGHVLRLPVDFLGRQSAGRLVTRVTTDVENLSELITTGLLLSLFDLVTIVGILGVLFWIDPRIAWYAIAITPVFLLLTSVFRRTARRAYDDVRKRLGRQNAFLGEILGGTSTTRAYGREAEVVGHWRELNAATRDGWNRAISAYASFFFVLDFIVKLATAGLLWIGCGAIFDGSMTAGTFVQAWLYFAKLSDPVRQLGDKYNVLQAALASARRLQDLLDQPESPIDTTSPRTVQTGNGGAVGVRFEGVRFSYVADEPVLRGIDLDVPAGTTCAIVGPTGAGKTTLLSLVSRLYDPDTGSVTFDGVDGREYALDELRSHIAVVPQDVFLFRGTILDNVRLFDPEVSEERVRDALDTVGALPFVEAHEGGLHAELDERGETLSAGERQLLSFARALVRDPWVLVLDEATAHVDTETEARLQAALRPLLSGRTCLVVAHRLSTVRRADSIAVLRDGALVERGSHDELVRADGAYAAMLRGEADDDAS